MLDAVAQMTVDALSPASVAAAAGAAALTAPPVAAIEVPARPSTLSVAAELAAAVMRNQVARRLARPASRRLLMSLFLSRVKRGPPSRHRGSATMLRFAPPH